MPDHVPSKLAAVALKLATAMGSLGMVDTQALIIAKQHADAAANMTRRQESREKLVLCIIDFFGCWGSCSISHG